MLKDYFVIEVDGITIVGQTFLPAVENQYPVVILCHGAPSGNPPDPNDGGYPALAETICHRGYHVIFFNFRGTGDSGGNFAMSGWTQDLQAVVDYILGLEGNRSRALYLVGFSAGAATSVYVAARDARISGVAACACPADFSLFLERDDPEGIIADYREIGAIRDADFPASARAWLENFIPVTPADHVAEIAPRPILLVHGGQDDVVPVTHASRLYAAAGEPKELVVVAEAGHKLRREPAVIKAVTDWLERYR